MKKFLQEFKEFALKGNVMDMAVGVIVGAAFGNIVSSFTLSIRLSQSSQAAQRRTKTA